MSWRDLLPNNSQPQNLVAKVAIVISKNEQMPQLPPNTVDRELQKPAAATYQRVEKAAQGLNINIDDLFKYFFSEEDCQSIANGTDSVKLIRAHIQCWMKTPLI